MNILILFLTENTILTLRNRSFTFHTLKTIFDSNFPTRPEGCRVYATPPGTPEIRSQATTIPGCCHIFLVSRCAKKHGNDQSHACVEKFLSTHRFLRIFTQNQNRWIWNVQQTYIQLTFFQLCPPLKDDSSLKRETGSNTHPPTHVQHTFTVCL